ncbi:MAG: hypothetical protein Q8P57_02835, partial [Candidatus Pacearchaeota archaeon]|nr:hypothetical protein [Candidatus Pacearchaeota archaeon]
MDIEFRISRLIRRDLISDALKCLNGERDSEKYIGVWVYGKRYAGKVINEFRKNRSFAEGGFELLQGEEVFSTGDWYVVDADGIVGLYRK